MTECQGQQVPVGVYTSLGAGLHARVYLLCLLFPGPYSMLTLYLQAKDTLVDSMGCGKLA